jgi:exosome complex exonuclease DIS3/RRP44
MLTSNAFVRRTRKGNVVKILKEHYLRDDVVCCSEICDSCELLPGYATLSGESYTILDTNVVLQQIDVLENALFQNCIIPQTVMDEVRHRNFAIYNRLRSIVANPEKHFVVFVNEFCRETYVEREENESINDRNDRAIRRVLGYYSKHLGSSIQLTLLTNDRDNMMKARQEGLQAFTIHSWVERSEELRPLLDTLAAPSTELPPTEDLSRPLFPEHLPTSILQEGIKAGKYLTGTFRISRSNIREGHISCSVQGEILLSDREGTNRAIDGDVVAVELLPRAQWHSASKDMVEEIEDGEQVEKEEEEDAEEEEEAEKAKKKKKPVTSSGAEAEVMPCGRVVGIIRRSGRHFVGVLRAVSDPSAQSHVFLPLNGRIPRIRVRTRQSSTLRDQRIVVAVDGWSRYSVYPMGHYVRTVGAVGSKEVESEVLLLEHDIPFEPFTQAVLDCLPSAGNSWKVPEDPKQWKPSNRRDLRHLNVCSIDPPSCVDIDDALHVRPLGDGTFEVGVHIADVTHFVKTDTAMDREAARRGTTVYLTENRIDMLPQLLGTNLCSLKSHVDRYAFSVLWIMTEKAEILSTDFCKSVIRSRHSFSYAEAQARIDDLQAQDELSQSLRTLMQLSRCMRQQRMNNGALVLASPDVHFSLDPENLNPVDMAQYEMKGTNSLVEEFMVRANSSVADRIRQTFPDCAVLRRHAAPPEDKFAPLVQALTALQLPVDITSGAAVSATLDGAIRENDPYFNTAVRILATRCMMQAQYFSAGDAPVEDYQHYGLALDIYTHFTSPIRRYADVLVHRQLAVAIGVTSKKSSLADMTGKKMKEVTEVLNYRKRQAEDAQRSSVELYTQLFFRGRIVYEPAIIVAIRQNAFSVLLPKYGIQATIYLRDIPTESLNLGATTHEKDWSLDEKTVTLLCRQQRFASLFDWLEVRISVTDNEAHRAKTCVEVHRCLAGPPSHLTPGGDAEHDSIPSNIQNTLQEARKHRLAIDDQALASTAEAASPTPSKKRKKSKSKSKETEAEAEKSRGAPRK